MDYLCYGLLMLWITYVMDYLCHGLLMLCITYEMITYAMDYLCCGLLKLRITGLRMPRNYWITYAKKLLDYLC